jgi:hypothetical protein
MYEQLDAAKLTGTVAARSCGLNRKITRQLYPPGQGNFKSGLRSARMGETNFKTTFIKERCLLVSRSSRSFSPWNAWRANKDYPEGTAVRLGRTLDENEYQATSEARHLPHFTVTDQPLHRADIMEVIDDLSEELVSHSELRYSNVVHTPSIFRPCARRGRRHGWCIIDFDCASTHTACSGVRLRRQHEEMQCWHQGWKYHDE